MNKIVTLPVITLRGLVLFPKMVFHFDIGRERSIAALDKAMKTERLVYLVAQKEASDEKPSENKLYNVGVVGEIKQVIKLPGMGLRVMVEGLYRAKTVGILGEEPYIEAEIAEFPLKSLKRTDPDEISAFVRTVKELFDEYADLSPKLPKEIIQSVTSEEDPLMLGEFLAGNLSISLKDKQRILAQSNVLTRLEILAHILENENNILGYERDLYMMVKEHVDKNQREYYLREQMKVIQRELGEGEESGLGEIASYVSKISKLGLSEEHEDKLIKEVTRLKKLPSQSHEAGVIRGYLDTCLSLPFNVKTKEKINIEQSRKLLEKEHYGMKKVKERILELMAVRKLAPDIKGQIICLAGPPGVGKTSVARSIAKALGRKYVRMSLGGVRDESDIRGHRKTYIGAMPGRIITGLKSAGSANPLFLLDEIDKLGSDHRGDPSSALLEVLDSEQNMAFVDHYIEIPFDLSDVLFVATANNIDAIPAPLRDRMEIIHMSGYTREEKFHIAKRHLLPKQTERHGHTKKSLKLEDSALYGLIDHYTRESGVRNLERFIATLARKAALKVVEQGGEKVTIGQSALVDYLGSKKFRTEQLTTQDEVGVVNGLAWTSVGGEMLKVEVAVLEGTGKLELTGSLGSVMKESAQTVISFVRSISKQYGIESDFYKTKDIHIHFPEGAVPKDGPSAGIAICTAVVSALTNRKVSRVVAMTGEITLRGKVLAIGGLKEKSMAAHRAGLTTVIIPKDNEPDLDEVDEAVKNSIKFVTVTDAHQVLALTLEKADEQLYDFDECKSVGIETPPMFEQNVVPVTV